jgi:hypothetical protein
VGGTVVTILLLSGVSFLSIRILGRVRSNVGATWRFGIASIARRARSSTSQIVALGIGVMAILLTMVRSDLWHQWQVSLPPDTPNHFLINIQPDQLGDVEVFFAQHELPPPTLTPIVRARLVSINGRSVDPSDFKDEFARRQARGTGRDASALLCTSVCSKNTSVGASNPSWVAIVSYAFSNSSGSMPKRSIGKPRARCSCTSRSL